MSTRELQGAPRTAGDMLQRAREYLERKQVPESRLAAELLVAHALGFGRLKLFLGLDRPVTAEEIERARSFLVRRGQREPVAYITGQREFYGRPFHVTRDVLIPRPETELLVDRARELAAVHADPNPALGDFGTGSGCIATTLALEILGARVTAMDSSAPALECAAANARRLGAGVRFVLGDTPGALCQGEGAPAALDFLLANPPYVMPEEAAELAPEVQGFEPREALFAPAGRPHYWLERLLGEGLELLRPGGFLLVELGHRQADAALELASQRGLAARVHPDLDGVGRVLEVTRG